MAKRTRTPPSAARARTKPTGRLGRPGIVHTGLYLLEALYEGLREAAFRERRKINEIVVEGVEMVLQKPRRRN